jgi:hypothetical protein
MRKLSIAVLIAAIAVMVALTGCGGGGGGGGGGGTPGPGPVTGNTIVTGTVRDNQSPAQAVANVVVDVGTLETRTDANGKFSFDLGSSIRLGDFLGNPFVFKVSTRLLAADQYPQVSVFYLGTGYEQIAANGGATIPINDFTLLMTQGGTVNLGQITVQFNDPRLPPPPPFP